MINKPRHRRIIITLGIIGIFISLYPIWTYISIGNPILTVPFLMGDGFLIWRIWVNMKEIKELE